MKIGWLILSFLFLIQPVLPVLEYVVNYEYIAEVLCINKENETLQCNGKCHLGKEIAKELGDTESPKEGHNLSNKIDLQLFLEDSFGFNFTTNIDLKITQIIPFEKILIHDPHTSTFSPPPELI